MKLLKSTLIKRPQKCIQALPPLRKSGISFIKRNAFYWVSPMVVETLHGVSPGAEQMHRKFAAFKCTHLDAAITNSFSLDLSF